MKVNPMVTTMGSVNPDDGRSAGSDKISRAKAIMEGKPAPAQETIEDKQVERAQNSIRRIKLKTQMSTNRHALASEENEQEQSVAENAQVQQPALTTEEVVKNDTVDTNIEAAATTEETKPLSPQFAALAKQKRLLQIKEKELAAKEAALSQKNPDQVSGYSKEQIKANALSVLREAGVTNDELTEALLREAQDYGPGFTKLEAEIKAIKEGLETQSKSQVERDNQAKQQVITQMTREADKLVAEGDTYEMVRESGYIPQAISLIERTFEKTGEILDVSEALDLIENELLEESLKFAKLKKVQSRLTPAQEQQSQQIQATKQDGPGRKIMRTLTNKDGVTSATMSKRERAIAAMEGRLK